MRNILYIIILAVALCACNNSTQIDGILDTAELMAVKHPDSAQTILETLYPFVVFLGEKRNTQDTFLYAEGVLPVWDLKKRTKCWG